jgi:hypothetical protein
MDIFCRRAIGRGLCGIMPQTPQELNPASPYLSGDERLTKLRAALANLDAAMAILTPDPEHIPSREKYRTGYFSRNELPGLVRNALREAGKPLPAFETTASCIAAKQLPLSALRCIQLIPS